MERERVLGERVNFPKVHSSALYGQRKFTLLTFSFVLAFETSGLLFMILVKRLANQFGFGFYSEMIR